MFCNYWGSEYVIHRAVYNIPLLDWTPGEMWKSWLGYGAQGPVLAIIVWVIAIITQKRRGFKNGHFIKKGIEDDGDKKDTEAGLNASNNNSLY
tara:strand:- start:108 stop:386 length:279 start_codon:yes stop_codon:yes gene_type:complete